MPAFVVHDAHIAAAPEALRPLLTHVRAQPTQAPPDVREVTSIRDAGIRVSRCNRCGLNSDSQVLEVDLHLKISQITIWQVVVAHRKLAVLDKCFQNHWQLT